MSVTKTFPRYDPSAPLIDPMSMDKGVRRLGMAWRDRDDGEAWAQAWFQFILRMRGQRK